MEIVVEDVGPGPEARDFLVQRLRFGRIPQAAHFELGSVDPAPPVEIRWSVDVEAVFEGFHPGREQHRAQRAPSPSLLEHLTP